jgi:D-methionine transport system ATP-binding protein
MQIRFEQVSLAAGRGNSPSKKPLPVTYYLLRDLSFEIAKGERVAIAGASGSGKTSLLRLLNRLTDLTQGKIYIDARSLQDIPVLQLRQQILYVSPEPKLLGMTVQEALKYPLMLRGIRDADQRIQNWLDRLKIPSDWLEKTELQLSTGERQWVSIARALLCESPVLLLDEPTANLDAGRSDRLLEVLHQMSQTGQTILVATHQLEWAEQFAQRVLHLQRGALVQESDRVDWREMKAAIAQVEAEEAAEWE